MNGKKERRLNVSWWSEEKANEVGKAAERRAPSSQLLGLELAESTQASQHLTAVRHAFPFLFLSWMLILAQQVQQTVLAGHVFGSPCASGVCSLWMTVGGRLLRSAQEFASQTQEGLLFFCKASGVCSASDHARCDKFKSPLHVCDPPLARQG